MVVVEKKLLSIILQIKTFQKKKQKISIKTCQQKKKNQQENIAEIWTKTWEKVEAKRVLRK